VTDYELVPAHLAVQAMRDNGYRNTAYAIAELIDNAIQAGATAVETICFEEWEHVAQRERRRIKAIAVLDNGDGMDADVLRMALQFGNGTRLHDRTGIGRFGMGLPSASISQCRRVDVWSWKQGRENALHTYIDIDDVTSGAQKSVPEPAPRTIPAEWAERAKTLGDSGTLVVWTQLDRCLWTTGKAILRNSDFLIGRMYRKFIETGQVSIRLAVHESRSSGPVEDEHAVANDPGYLMDTTSTPAPFDAEPMFVADGDKWEITQKIAFRGSTHEVKIRFSLAKEAARNGHNAGATPHGKHAARNIGVSLVRAGRELDLDQALVNTYDPRERWWGVEIEFPPSLDELFGVTNNKQAARHFSEVAERLETLKGTANSDWLAYKRQLAEDGDPTLPIMDLIELVDRRIAVMRKVIQVQRQGAANRRKRHDPDSPEAVATKLTRQRQEEGHRGQSDADEGLPSDERKTRITKELVETGIAQGDAEETAARLVDDGLKYTFAEADLEGFSFFSVKPAGGDIVIKLNTNHPAYRNLDQILAAPPEDEEDEAKLRDRLSRASHGLRLLLLAWARLEDEQPTPRARAEMQEVRGNWGAMAYRFLETDD
jgi:hypothetical protein